MYYYYLFAVWSTHFILNLISVPQELFYIIVNKASLFAGQSCGLDKHNLSNGTIDVEIWHVKNSIETEIGKRSVYTEVRTTKIDC